MANSDIMLNYCRSVVQGLLHYAAHTATVYVSPKLVVRATRRMYRRGGQGERVEVLLTVGRPNYLERRFVKACQKAEEPFPVAKIQFRMPAKRRTGK